MNLKFSDRNYASRKMVAAELDIGESTLGEFVRLERNFPPDLIVPLVKATGDLDYIRFFTRPLGLGIHRVPEGKAAEAPELLLDRLAAAMEAFGVLAQDVARSKRIGSEGGECVTSAEARCITEAYHWTLEIMAAVVATVRVQAGEAGDAIL